MECWEIFYQRAIAPNCVLHMCTTRSRTVPAGRILDTVESPTPIQIYRCKFCMCDQTPSFSSISDYVEKPTYIHFYVLRAQMLGEAAGILHGDSFYMHKLYAFLNPKNGRFCSQFSTLFL